MEDKIDKANVEMAVVERATMKYRLLTTDEVRACVRCVRACGDACARRWRLCWHDWLLNECTMNARDKRIAPSLVEPLDRREHRRAFSDLFAFRLVLLCDDVITRAATRYRCHAPAATSCARPRAASTLALHTASIRTLALCVTHTSTSPHERVSSDVRVVHVQHQERQLGHRDLRVCA
jgi:hypothetical protein